jgi:hypothetical protein
MMSKVLLICFALAVATFSISVPCVIFQASKNGAASDCSISRLDDNTLAWGVNITFNLDFSWNASSTYNVLADMGSPRLPVEPNKSQCETKAGKYTKGQSVLVNCTQSFDLIPVGYSNVITAFDGDDYPLGFSTKVPLSTPAPEGNLQTQ